MFRHLIPIIIIIFSLLSCGDRHYKPEKDDEILDMPDKNNEEGTIEDDGSKLEEEATPGKGKIVVTENKSVAELYSVLKNGVFQVHAYFNEEEFSQGSGFFIAKDIGITNYHVLEGTKEGFILISNQYYPIEEILEYSVSEEMDYVIFRTSYQSESVLPVSNKLPRTGEDIFAIGSPKSLNNSLSKGIISSWRGQNRIQIDATIDHGSSGGPLFNMSGEVIGVTSSGLGTGSDLNFAINIQAIPYKNYVLD